LLNYCSWWIGWDRQKALSDFCSIRVSSKIYCKAIQLIYCARRLDCEKKEKEKIKLKRKKKEKEIN
jgi:hypothetical protein